MGSLDRYAFIDEFCRIPESDEELLCRGRFAGEPETNDDEDYVSVESTETPEEGGIGEAAEGEVFLSPREESSLASSAVAEERAVDLGRDTDVGCYSEAGGGVEIRVSRIGDFRVPSNPGHSPPLKRLKTWDAEVELGVARDNLRADTTGERSKSRDDIAKKEEITLLDVLKMLRDDDDDGGSEGLTVWDAAKKKGMTFP